jgi:hypothetical protein
VFHLLNLVVSSHQLGVSPPQSGGFISSTWWFHLLNLVVSSHQLDGFTSSTWWFHILNLVVSPPQSGGFISSIVDEMKPPD